MRILGFDLKKAVAEKPIIEPVIESVIQHSPTAANTMFSWSYDGEKNMGEIGPIVQYTVDYDGLRLRSWQAMLESEIAQFVLKKKQLWVIGAGLKLQSEPLKEVLLTENIKIDSEGFNRVAEARFRAYAKSKRSDYSGMSNIHTKAAEAFTNATIGGDVLVILRYIDGQVKVQLVDGAHLGGDFGTENALQSNGNTIKNGIELDAKGEHIAFHIRTKKFGSSERVLAKSESTGLTVAYLVYGMRYRLDNHRGLPLISAVLETLKKLERYSSATLGSAEERQKIAYVIEHEAYSDGSSPLSGRLAKALDYDAKETAPTITGDQLATNVAATTNKATFNMTQGAHLKSLESKNELYFTDYYTTNINLVCAALCIPPEVAMSKYDSNFSASRAAIKDWEHTINVDRNTFSFQFYQPIYDFWLHIEILKNKIQANGYLTAFKNKNHVVLDAFRNARFVGTPIPHIDPLKEVKAEREKLGELGRNIPLTTVEASTENLNSGEADSNMSQFSLEYEFSKKLGFNLPTP